MLERAPLSLLLPLALLRSHWYYLADIHTGETRFNVPAEQRGSWTQVSPFIFANGLSTPPELNRDLPPQNYISPGTSIAGLSLMGVALFVTLMSTMFVYWKRKHSVIVQSQPIFLYVLMLGTAMMSASILTISFDEQTWTGRQLDGACVAAPWLISLGYNVIYLALFSKLWRIDRVMQFARRKVRAKQVVGPFVATIALNFAVLVTWTVADPFTWNRHDIDADTGESYGRCNSQHAVVFVGILILLMFISTVACGYMAFRCRDIDSRFSESNWIFYTIYTQIQVLVVGIPILVTLNEASADATYLGRALLIFVIVISTVALMIGPKIMMVIFGEGVFERGGGMNNDTLSGGGGARGSGVGGGAKVTGVGVDITSTVERRRESSSFLERLQTEKRSAYKHSSFSIHSRDSASRSREFSDDGIIRLDQLVESNARLMQKVDESNDELLKEQPEEPGLIRRSGDIVD